MCLGASESPKAGVAARGPVGGEGAEACGADDAAQRVSERHKTQGTLVGTLLAAPRLTRAPSGTATATLGGDGPDLAAMQATPYKADSHDAQGAPLGSDMGEPRTPPIDHSTVCTLGDGCLQEGTLHDSCA